jgi:lactoylglutathione lyase
MRIYDYDHVGIWVSNLAKSLEFYATFGFQLSKELPERQAVELTTADGVILNLIFNVTHGDGSNILIDRKEKYPGITHPAFLVNHLDAVIDVCCQHDIRITEGPGLIGERRRALFIRDPDGNVLEFDELIKS